MHIVMGSGLTLALLVAGYVIAWRRGFRTGYRLGRAQASVEEAGKEIDWLKRISHPSRWSVNKGGEVLDLEAVRERAK